MESARSATAETPKHHFNILSIFLLAVGTISILAILTLGWLSYKLLKSKNFIKTTPQNNVQMVNTKTQPAGDSNKLPGFITDTSQTSVDISALYKQGPAKDAVPSIDKPNFVNASDVNLAPNTKGILVKIPEGEVRFYPFNILVWHEIVNDSVDSTGFDGKPLTRYFAVTYCPVTGTSAVFNTNIDNQPASFGVSGLLYESNLVMYDRKTETLWSQSLHQGIVGKYNKQKLELMDTQVVMLSDVLKNYPAAKVLSSDTGYVRDYTYNPYSEYEKSDVLYPDFKLSYKDERQPIKQEMYVLPIGDKSIIFNPASLVEGRTYKYKKEGIGFTVKKVNSEIIAEDTTCTTADCKVIANYDPHINGYYEMWFSWAVHHQDDGVLWNLR